MYYFVLISHYAHPVWSPSPSTGEGRGEGLFSPSTGEMPFRAERVFILSPSMGEMPFRAERVFFYFTNTVEPSTTPTTSTF